MNLPRIWTKTTNIDAPNIAPAPANANLGLAALRLPSGFKPVVGTPFSLAVPAVNAGVTVGVGIPKGLALLMVVGRTAVVGWVEVGTMTTMDVDTEGTVDVELVVATGAAPVLVVFATDVAVL